MSDILEYLWLCAALELIGVVCGVCNIGVDGSGVCNIGVDGSGVCNIGVDRSGVWCVQHWS